MTPAERARGLFASSTWKACCAPTARDAATFYKEMTAIGAMTINEVRAKENLPPVEGGDVHHPDAERADLEASGHRRSVRALDDERESLTGVLGTRQRRGEAQLKVRDFALSVKASGVADDGTFEGYGSVFGVVDSYQEVVAPGAFADSLAELAGQEPHGPGPVAAPQRSADRRLSRASHEDDTGLFVKGQLLIGEVAQAKPRRTR
jgi:hypothetical protein